MDNVTGWDSVVGARAQVKGVVHFDVPEDVMIARIQERSQGSGRQDDDPEVLRKRLVTNREQCEPIVAM